MGTAEIMEAPAGKLKAQIMEPMRRTEEKKPESIQKLDNGSYVITAPHMMSGWIKLVIRGADAGDKVTITYGEKRGSDGQVQKLGGKDGVNAGWWPKATTSRTTTSVKARLWRPLSRNSATRDITTYRSTTIPGN